MGRCRGHARGCSGGSRRRRPRRHAPRRGARSSGVRIRRAVVGEEAVVRLVHRGLEGQSSRPAKPGTPPEGRTMFTSMPRRPCRAARVRTKLTRSLGNGGPCQRTSHGVPPSRAPRAAADGGSTRSSEPSLRFSFGRLPDHVARHAGLGRRALHERPQRGSRARSAADRYASIGSTGSMMWVSASKIRWPARVMAASTSHLRAVPVREAPDQIDARLLHGAAPRPRWNASS